MNLMKKAMWLLTAVLLVWGVARAQLGTSAPAPSPIAKAPAAQPAAQSGLPAGVPAGSGPGVHSPNSPFAQLKERSDVLAWSLLTTVKTRVEKNRLLPVFPPPVLALDQKIQRVQGFMMPLEPGEKQTHFLLTSVPLTCSFCVPGGPESMIEVKTKVAVKYSLEPVVVEGRFAVLHDDSYGLYYRVTDAVAVK